MDGSQHEHGDRGVGALDRLVGTWRVTGGVEGEVTYRWLEGGRFLVQDVRLEDHGQLITGLEVIGRERPFGAVEASADIRARFYGNSGETLDYVYEIEGDVLTIWAGERGSPAYLRSVFDPSGEVLEGAWVYPDGGGYPSVSTRVPATPDASADWPAATLTSADGTTIGYAVTGSGPAIVVVSNVAEDHTGVAGLVTALAERFTVVTYDRRGRRGSGDPQPYDPAREIDDLAALVDVVGGRAALTSGSGGCGLVLDAAAALGERITGVYLYEPPFIVDDSGTPAPADYVERQEALVAAGEHGAAVEFFMTEMIGVPAEYLPMMKDDPSWQGMVDHAHTYAYEGRILRGLQDGTPLPTDRWPIAAPVGVGVGEHAERFIRQAAHALVAVLPDAVVLDLPGHDHSAFWTSPAAVAQQAGTFLREAGMRP